jgi:plasmid maintenance system killer protein
MDLIVNAYADLHGEVESYWDLWLNQQWELWLNAEDYIDNLKSSATFLNGRKSKCKD